ncbi:unnamed protein product [Candida verbasci]|uniref:HTH APSES-type domain-containing protein n=1 Tax=Candida verbasci TaxID=1227364 RepID=A0A9W4TVU4_9ASCO|nr:unnamed protein product [Candida verbasci]
MDSPINIGDLTTQSIQQKLTDTSLNKSEVVTSFQQNIYSSVNSSIKCIQLNLKFKDVEVIILRRVQDSYINISQLLSILLKLNIYTKSQIDNFMNVEIINNLEFNEYNSYLDIKEPNILKGIWIPYDKAVNLSMKFDLYDMIKQLLLIDVHQFEELPKINNKRNNEDSSTILESPLKKQKLETDYVSKFLKNDNFPFSEPPIMHESNEIVNEMRSKLSEIFKENEKRELDINSISNILKQITDKYATESFFDVTLDSKLNTALHFSGTLASINLISSFIKLGICSPVRGNINGENPLITCIQVRNSMDMGNFSEILSKWLYPNIFLFDNMNQSILHHLSIQSNESFKYYTVKLIEYLISNDAFFIKFRDEILNSQDKDGNTSLHNAIERENKWLIKLLIKLGSNVQIQNKRGIKPDDFKILNEIDNDSDELIFNLIDTKLDFLSKRFEISQNIEEIEEPSEIKPVEHEINGSSNSNMILSSIQQLLNTTNSEYESILNSKRQEIKDLDKLLHDSTIITANNKFTSKKISEKLVKLDNLKLQVANLSDKLLLNSQELNLDIPEDKEFDADEPFIIKPIYEKLINGESIDSLRNDSSILDSLQPIPILKARIQAYKTINSNLESELSTLIDYNELTSKFKKVVSICTNVDINEVDELLDGLLEAVEQS